MIWYLVSIFLAAFLLFQVQPLIAKYILPWYGGSPGVWTTCMLFFQALLLGGYGYAHWLSRALPGRTQGRLHAVLLGLAGLTLLFQFLAWGTPLLPSVAWRPAGDAEPTLGILWLLFFSIGVPYLLLASTSPLLQRWYSIEYSGRSPYRLFSLSNLGSLLALVTFPFLFEPFLNLRTHAWLWLVLFLGFGAGCAHCSLRRKGGIALASLPGSMSKDDSIEGSESERSETAVGAAPLWFLLAACASVLLLAVTNHLCQEVAVIPFLWILPLSVYLISFVVCFDNHSWYTRRWFLPLFFAATVAAWVALFTASDVGIRTEIAIFTALLFLGCMICHGELYRLRPHPRSLTRFYLSVAAGGAMGGFFVSIVAPLLFSGYWELPLGMVLTWVLVGTVFARERVSGAEAGFQWCAYGFIGLFMGLMAKRLVDALPRIAAGTFGGLRIEVIVLGALLTAAALVALVRLPPHSLFHIRSPMWPRVTLVSVILGQVVITGLLIEGDRRHALERTRNFYGTLKVTERVAGEGTVSRIRTLVHGRTVHGLQSLDAERRTFPTAYYGPRSGVGLVLRDASHGPSLRQCGDPWHIGVVGLGVGTLAAYGKPADVLRFYEINADVVRIARDQDYFSFLTDSRAAVEISLGDARLSLEIDLREGGSREFDLLVLDAFSSDAIPVHLLTREAMALYLAHLKQPDGLLALHVSNRYLDLRPLVASLAEDYGLASRWIYAHTGGDELQRPSSWVLLAADESVFTDLDPFLPSDARDRPDRRVASWTDSFSNLFQVIR